MKPTCSSSRCGAPILWARSETTGRLMPLDPDPVDTGNVILTGATETVGAQEMPVARMLSKGEHEARTRGAGGMFPDTTPRYVSHFTTCPDGPGFRR